MTDKPKPADPTRPIGYTSCCDVWAATQSKHRAGCPGADPDSAAATRDRLGFPAATEEQRTAGLDAALDDVPTVAVTERDALRALNTELTADFHRAQNELDCAEQDRDAVIARAEAAEAQIERIREAMKGYPDSDLVSLAETLQRFYEAAEARLAELDKHIAERLGGASPASLYPLERDAMERHESRQERDDNAE